LTKLSKESLLFAFGIVLTTMTNIRFSSLPIGPGEIVLGIWMVIVSIGLIKSRYIIEKENTFFIKYWVLFIVLMIIGGVISLVSDRFILNYVVYDLIAYAFSFSICLVLLYQGRLQLFIQKIKYCVVLGGVIFTFLALWHSMISPSFFGLSLGGYRFTGGANNPNQLALFLSAIPFIAFFLLVGTKKTNIRIVYGTVLLGTIFAGLETKSDGLVASWVMATIILILAHIVRRIDRPARLPVILLIISSIGFIAVLNNELIYTTLNYIRNTFNELDQDGSRGSLWMQGLETFMGSPIFGFGPGPQLVYYGDYRFEVHNTFIDLLTQIGFLGMLLHLWFLSKSLLKVRHSSILFTAMICLILFSASHFVLRQPIYWFYILSLIQLSLDHKHNQIDNSIITNRIKLGIDHIG
jgi:O-antigen ligase